MQTRVLTFRSLPPAAKRFALLAFALLIGRFDPVQAAPQVETIASANRVVITLHPKQRSSSKLVRVADVADISGGDDLLRKRIAALDLDEAPPTGGKTEISTRQIEFRLRLAGIDPQLVSIRGSNEVVNKAAVRRDSLLASTAVRSGDTQETKSNSYALLASHSVVRPVADSVLEESEVLQAVMAAARKCLVKHLPWPEEKVGIQLAQTLPRELRELSMSVGTTFNADLRTAVTPVGRVALRLTVMSPDQQAREYPVQFDVRRFEDVVVALRPFDRGHVFSSTDLVIARQDVTSMSGYSTSVDQLVGQRAARVLSESQVIRAIDVQPTSGAAGPVLVKYRSRVKLFIRSGALMVTVVGEAQQDGRAGEIIRIKNVDSNHIMSGRVLSATEVEVID